MNEPRRHCSQKKKPKTKGHELSDSTQVQVRPQTGGGQAREGGEERFKGVQVALWSEGHGSGSRWKVAHCEYTKYSL